MLRGLYAATSGLITSQAKQEVIMNNMANSETTGYKGEKLSIKSFDNVLISNRDKVVAGRNVRNDIGYLSNGAEINERTTNFEQGSIGDTGVSTDFAIQNEGFFVVQRTEGNTVKNYYTRDGHFSVDLNGYLVTSNGDRVLSMNESGATSPIYVGDGNMSVNKAGEITIDGRRAGQFAIADFDKTNGKYENLTKVSYNLYEGENPKAATGYNVMQSSLEGSNVNILNEMTDMMAVMRNFESNSKVVKALNETLDKAVNQVGRV